MMSERYSHASNAQFKRDVAHVVSTKVNIDRSIADRSAPHSAVWWDEPDGADGEADIAADEFKSTRVLLVDGDPVIRRHGALLLRTLGYEVEVCSDGFAALDAVLRSPQGFDLLLTEISMPGMNGRVLASRVQTLRPATKVLFTSGLSQEPPSASPGDGEGVRFLLKPYTVSALATIIRQMVDSEVRR